MSHSQNNCMRTARLKPEFSVVIHGPIADESRRVLAKDLDIFQAYDCIWRSMYSYSALRVTTKSGSILAVPTFLRMVRHVEQAVELI